MTLNVTDNQYVRLS